MESLPCKRAVGCFAPKNELISKWQTPQETPKSEHRTRLSDCSISTQQRRSPAKMSRPMAPSKSLLSTLSRALRNGSSTTQCPRTTLSASSTIMPSRTCVNAAPRRALSSSPSRKAYRTVEEQKSRYRSGVCPHIFPKSDEVMKV